MLTFALLLSGCAGDSSAGGPRPVPADRPPADPGAVSATPTLTASCSPSEANALRVDCTVSVDPPAAVQIVYAPEDDALEPRIVDSPEVLSEHTLVLYGMSAETPYAWTATALDLAAPEAVGRFDTAPVPADLRFATGVQGGSDAPDDLLFLFGCGDEPYAVVVDRDGTLVWYQALAEGLAGGPHTGEALSLTPEGTLLAVVDRAVVREYDFDGNLLLDVGDLDRPVHHDLARRDGFTWVLNAREGRYGDGETYIIDGVYVLDAAGGVVASWDLDSVITPSGGVSPAFYWSGTFPLDDIDWSHGNSITIDETGTAWLSFYALDTVLGVDLWPGSPEFGTLRAVLAGSRRSPWSDQRDYTISSTVTPDWTFEAQHHPHVLTDGRLMLFDNGLWGSSRALVLSLDPGAGLATIDEEYPLGLFCAFQGGAFPLSNGGVIAACAPFATFVEFAPGDPAPIRQLSPTCADGGPRTVPRVIPIRL